jgi:hypothetical protein
MQQEYVTDELGVVHAVIQYEGDVYRVWRREKVQFPPRARNTLIGSYRSIEEARRVARALLDARSLPAER